MVIGLPSAILFAESGINVLGVDIKEDLIQNLRAGNSHINEPLIDCLLKNNINSGRLTISDKPDFADTFFITVPTPVRNTNGNNKPNLEFVYSAIDSIIPFLKKGNKIILESTCPVGTTEKIHSMILEKKGFKDGDIFMAYCPERVLPGIVHELINNERIIGGIDTSSSIKIKEIYEKICKSKSELQIVKLQN